jgi:alpha,alpha-trehalase
VPISRPYEPGINVTVTTWKTPTGWVVVRDALTMGPTPGPDMVTPHTRPPADDDAEHVLVRTAECIDGQVEMELVCEPVTATWNLVDGTSHVAEATGGDAVLRLQTDLLVGVAGEYVRARHVLRPGDRAYCSLTWAERFDAPVDVNDADGRLAATIAYWRRWFDGRGAPTTGPGRRSSARRS